MRGRTDTCLAAAAGLDGGKQQVVVGDAEHECRKRRRRGRLQLSQVRSQRGVGRALPQREGSTGERGRGRAGHAPHTQAAGHAPHTPPTGEDNKVTCEDGCACVRLAKVADCMGSFSENTSFNSAREKYLGTGSGRG